MLFPTPTSTPCPATRVSTFARVGPGGRARVGVGVVLSTTSSRVHVLGLVGLSVIWKLPDLALAKVLGD